MATPAAPVTSHQSPVTAGGTPAWYRIQDPSSGLYVRFTCKPGRITARLTKRDRASRFPRHAAAAECFALVLAGQPLEIVRSDA